MATYVILSQVCRQHSMTPRIQSRCRQSIRKIKADCPAYLLHSYATWPYDVVDVVESVTAQVEKAAMIIRAYATRPPRP